MDQLLSNDEEVILSTGLSCFAGTDTMEVPTAIGRTEAPTGIGRL